MYIVKKGEDVGRVQIVHWWPGRDFTPAKKGFGFFINPIPSYVRGRAQRMGSKYLTMARVVFRDGELATYAACCPKDQPSRATGRFIALRRMNRLLKSMGLKMEKA